MITAELPQDVIDDIFKEAETQSDYIVGLYRAAVPELDKVATMGHNPKVSKATSDYIFSKAIEFDKEHHSNVINGGAWMSVGFGADLGKDPDIDVDWIVVIDDDAIDYRDE